MHTIGGVCPHLVLGSLVPGSPESVFKAMVGEDVNIANLLPFLQISAVMHVHALASDISYKCQGIYSEVKVKLIVDSLVRVLYTAKYTLGVGNMCRWP